MLIQLIKNKLAKDFIKISIGNILEWYDFTLYGLFALQLSQAFFPEIDKTSGLLMVFMTFAVGFVARPIGAVIFGLMGDRYGRKYAVNLSIWLMVIPTVLIGCIPTYQDIGIWAPILLIILRIMQGISAGGQFSGLIIVANDTQTKYRSFLISLVYSISVIGSFIATFISYLCLKFTQLLENPAIIEQTWRFPFLLSAVIFLVYIKLNKNISYSMKAKKTGVKLRNILNSQPRELFALIIFSAANGSIYYILYNYLVTYLEVHLNVSQSYAFIIENSILLLSIMLYPWFGLRASHDGSRVKKAIINILWMLGVIPLFYLSNFSLGFSLVGLIILVINQCALTSYLISLFAELFNNNYRMTAFSLAFNVGATISGFAPLFAEHISKYSKFSILLFLLSALIILLINLCLIPRNNKSFIESASL